ncbi:hypothetical protein [Chitinophaga rhizophila]|uniref:Lipoprotein n=1 Tax=Chitinophaga rhizophila TaxID=2866212 RepID=A0ABS7GJT0_9BACT|nr:hypothetical protein [Chitinophaga rhizophila]MBW8687970.1 hypothetical protein [Chitinophaga rhizophila]
MSMSSIFPAILSVVFLACNHRTPDTQAKTTDRRVVSTSSIDTTLQPKAPDAVFVTDTIKRYIVDDYAVTNEMFAASRDDSATYKKQSGDIFSFDKVWFTNNTLKQTIVFELYTDYHRMVTYHFYNDDTPAGLVSQIALHQHNGQSATAEQKLRAFSGFLDQAKEIDAHYFTTNNGFKLGDTRRKAIKLLGNPDKTVTTEDIEKLEWEFVGEDFYDRKSDLHGKPLAKDSFGHHISMYFRKGLLVGIILFNDIP